MLISRLNNYIVKFNNLNIEIIVLFSATLNFFLIWYLQQIKNINFGTSLGFFFLDTNCADQKMSLYKHCFGDFNIYLNSNEVSAEIVTNARNIYPPSSLILFYPFDLLNSYLSNEVALYTYLVLAILLNIFGSHYLMRKNNLKHSLFTWICLNFLSIPLLVSFERGNSILFTPFFFTLLLIGVLMDRPKYIVISILMLVILKPQFILFILVFFLIKKYLIPVYVILIYGLFNFVLSYVMYGNAFAYLQKFITAYRQLNNTQKISDLWPINISPAHTLSKIGLKVGFNLNPAYYLVISILIFLIIFLFYFILMKNIAFHDRSTLNIIILIFLLLTFSSYIYSHAPIYYFSASYVFLFFTYIYGNSSANIFLNFIFKLNLIFITFYFPIFKNTSILSRFDQKITIFVTYNSYILHALNFLLITLFFIYLNKNKVLK